MYPTIVGYALASHATAGPRTCVRDRLLARTPSGHGLAGSPRGTGHGRTSYDLRLRFTTYGDASRPTSRANTHRHAPTRTQGAHPGAEVRTSLGHGVLNATLSGQATQATQRNEMMIFASLALCAPLLAGPRFLHAPHHCSVRASQPRHCRPAILTHDHLLAGCTRCGVTRWRTGSLATLTRSAPPPPTNHTTHPGAEVRTALGHGVLNATLSGQASKQASKQHRQAK